MNITEKIKKLAADRKAVLLAHNYQRPEIQDLADHTGDSFALSVVASEIEAEVIIFCGVHFMAESAAILAPEKKIILPDMEAGCPLAEMIDAEAVRQLRRRHPGATVVSYVNTSAEVKAESDYCCTSANALAVVEAVPSEEIIFLPDRNLADYVRQRTTKKIMAWDGFCPVHEEVKTDDIYAIRRKEPGAIFAAHPECRPEVLAMAGHICSTTGMYRFVASSPADAFIIGTEEGVLHRLRRDNPGKIFHLPREPMVCPNMKRTTLEKVLEALEKMINVVEVPEEIGRRARKSLQRMVSISG